jgi:hypothetical protein
MISLSISVAQGHDYKNRHYETNKDAHAFIRADFQMK